MTVRVGPHQLKILNQWLHAVIPSSAPYVQLPGLVAQLADYMRKRGLGVVRADHGAKGYLDGLDGVVPCVGWIRVAAPYAWLQARPRCSLAGS
jgi:hypothetical protein